MTETQIQSQIISYLTILERQGKLFFNRMNNIPPVNKLPNGKMQFRRLPAGAKRGIPDIWVIINGLSVGLEVKTKTGKQSKYQKEIEKSFKNNGAEYHVVRSVDEVVEVLKGHI